MIFVREIAGFRIVLIQVRIDSVLHGNHRQGIPLADLLQFRLHVPVPLRHGEEQDHRRFIRLGQDFLHHGFKAAESGGFLPVVHRVFDDDQIRQPVRIRFRNPPEHIPPVTHIAEGGRGASHAGVDQMDAASAGSVRRCEPDRNALRPAFIVTGRPRAFRNGSAHRGQRQRFAAPRAFQHLLQPVIVSR